MTDTSGALVQGADVRLTNVATNDVRTTQTDSAGFYRFLNLAPADYRVEVQMTGFKQYRREPISVRVDASVRIDVALEIGAVSDTVEVKAETPMLQPQTSSLGQVVEGRAVQEMPLNGRNVLNLAALVPGVIPQGGAEGSPNGKNVFAWGNYQISGGEAGQSSTTVDGVPVETAYLHMTALIPTQDNVQEFKVQTNASGAEFGRFAGGVINLATRSGSNAYHGTLYEYLRNRSLNANTWIANKSGLERPPFVQNQFGANLGGPVKKDKLFFFGSWESYRQRVGGTYQTSVPTAKERAGDFSEIPTPIYDPFSVTNPSQLPRTPFPGNKIPSNLLDPIAQKMQDLYAEPNMPGYVNNFVKNYSDGSNSKQFNGRADYNVSEKQRIFLRWTGWWTGILGSDPFGTQTHPIDTPESEVTHQAVLADTYVLSPSTILDVRLGYQRFSYQRTPASEGYDITQQGWPQWIKDSLYYSHKPYPCVGDAYGAFCGQGTGSIIQSANDNDSVLASMTMVRGSHTLKFGVDVRRLTHNYIQSNQPAGLYAFDQGFTSSSPFGGSGGWGYASFMLGTSSWGGISLPAPDAAQRIYRAGYINDSWQVNSRLNLTMGLRYDYEGPWSERFDRISVFLPDVQNPVAQAAGAPSLGTLALVNSDLRKSRNSKDGPSRPLGPRLGFAYRINDKTVVRGGYSLVWLPADADNLDNPGWDPVSTGYTPMQGTLDGVTVNATLSNPRWTSLNSPAGRNAQLLQAQTGSNPQQPIPGEAYPYVQQWNFNLQRQVASDLLFDVAYAGTKSTHLWGPYNLNQLPDQYLSLGDQLNQTVPNPYYGYITQGQTGPTTTYGQLLRPFPIWGNVIDPTRATYDAIYHSLQVKMEKRFSTHGNILVAYTAGKNITNSQGTFTSWLEPTSSTRSCDAYNLSNCRSLANFDVSQRLVVSYVYDLPFGKGHRFGGGLNGVSSKLISGWILSGITTLQSGFPLSVVPIYGPVSNFQGNQHVNNNGQSAKLSGDVHQRLNQYFDTSVFSFAPAYTWGNTSPTLPDVRGPGINNFDLSLVKDTTIKESLRLQFRAEFFNLFNRVRFAMPDSALGSSTFGQITNSMNDPRFIQFALRASF